MRFLLVGLSAVLVAGSLPLPVVAEKLPVIEETSAVATASGATNVSGQKNETDESQKNEFLQPEAILTETAPPDSPMIKSIDDPQQPLVLESAIITEIQTAGTDEFVELYNPNNEPLSLAGISLWYRGSGASIIQLVSLDSVVMEAKSFVVVGHVANAAKPVTPFIKASYSLNDTTGEVFMSTAATGAAVFDKVAWGNVAAADGYIFDVKPATAPVKNNSLQRCFSNGIVVYGDPRDTSKEFSIYTNDLPTPFLGMACVVPESPKPVNNCEGVRINEIAANVIDQFIELKNDTDHDVILTGCQLQTNRSMTKSYIFGEEILHAGAQRAVYINGTDLTLTKTTSGMVYVVSSDGLNEIDVQAYANLAPDTSWSRSETSEWTQTYILTPDEPNLIEKYLPCSEGYERNEDTGRCNKITVTETLLDCGDGKYRSEETGRCRNIPVTSILAACKLGQYRSEETSRCRNIVTASVQKPCKDNQYRSEETNRCRNVPTVTAPDAAFAVQPIKETGTAFVGWWALGGVSLLAVGYGIWEWRDEIRRSIVRFASRFSAGR